MTGSIVQAMRNTKPYYFPGALFSLPEYEGWQAEQMSWHETVCIGSWSFAPWGVLEGPETTKLLQDYSINSFANNPVGQVKHLVGCNTKGKVLAEGILMKVAEEKFLITTLPWWQYIATLGRYDVHFTPAAPGSITLYQVCGPRALYLLEEVCGESLRDVKFMHFKDVKIAGHDVKATNGLTMSGEIGFELRFSSEYHDEILDLLLKAGEKYGACHLGSRTAMQHVEAAFPTMGFQYLPAVADDDDELVAGFRHFMSGGQVSNESQFKLAGSFESDDVRDYYFSPLELGWSSHLKFDHDFYGRAALELEARQPKRRIITFEFDKADVVAIYASLFDEGEPYRYLDIPIYDFMTIQADRVMQGGRLVGISTTPFYSYYYRKMLAIGFVDTAVELDSRVEITWGDPGTPQKIIHATVKQSPYKPDRRRTRLTDLPLTFPGR
ncbi:MAG: hypothetical protein LBJ48_03190 [Coriobacteriales bacterium]|jgi:vanillate/3-O-methylgallate O-demethylase|nr:hypothetical protein [Coriobacteriales bacterium]